MVAQPPGPHVVGVPAHLWSAAEAKAMAEGTTITAVIVDALINYTARYTAEQVVDLLVREGHDADHVRAVFTSLIAAGLPLDQSEYHTLVSPAELHQVRLQLSAEKSCQ